MDHADGSCWAWIMLGMDHADRGRPFKDAIYIHFSVVLVQEFLEVLVLCELILVALILFVLLASEVGVFHLCIDGEFVGGWRICHCACCEV